MSEQNPVAPGSALGSVLLAQNTPFLQAYFQRTLTRLGVESISVASDGKRALDMLQADVFDLLLLDLDLPRISGLKLLETLRSDPLYDDLPIVVTTNSCDHDTVTRALELGVSDFLSKPYAQNSVDARIRRAIDARNAPAPSAPSFLVAHQDLKFYEAVARAFGGRTNVHVAQNVGMFLARAARFRPDVVIVEPTMFRARLEFCMRSMAQLRDPVPIVISVGELTASQRPANYLGAVPSNVQPEGLEHCISDLLENRGARSAGMPSRETFVSIVQQAFGMLAAMDVEPTKEASLPADTLTVAVDLYEGGQELWTVEIQANAETAIAVTTDIMSASRGTVAPDHSLRGVGEIARVVARRIRQIALESNIRLEVGHPREAAAPQYGGAECIVFRAEDVAPFSAALGEAPSAGARQNRAANTLRHQAAAPQFMVLVFGAEASIGKMTEAENRTFADSYRAWIDLCNESNSILAGGGIEFGTGRRVRRDDNGISIDQGPWPEDQQTVLGCWQIEANDYDQAVTWALKNPFEADSVEVRRIAPHLAVGLVSSNATTTEALNAHSAKR